MPAAFAIAAHPDDIEFHMAGTLVLLRQAGWETHTMTVADGSCGGTRFDAKTLARRRAREARRAAAILGAHPHPSLCRDLEIFYADKLLRRLAALIREVRPAIVLTQPPVDYMEDHTNTCRLVVTATFARGMPNYRTVPPRPPFPGETVVYHSVPHGLHDPLGRLTVPELFVNTAAVHDLKHRALAAHESQRTWLESTQDLDSMGQMLDDCSRAVGRMSRQFKHAEGWWRHFNLGFAAAGADPLAEALSQFVGRRSASRKQ
jgi:LmbE family N-acetylglucosaminyl deacetylase